MNSWSGGRLVMKRLCLPVRSGPPLKVVLSQFLDKCFAALKSRVSLVFSALSVVVMVRKGFGGL